MKKQTIKNAAVLSTTLVMQLALRGALADTGVNYLGGTYTQNFNSLATYDPNTATWSNNTVAPSNLEPGASIIPIYASVDAGVHNNGVPINLTGPSADDPTSIAHIGSLMDGWWAINQGGQNKVLNYNVTNGLSDTAALTAFYDGPAQTISGTNLALGVTAAAETGFVTFGVRLVNNSGTTLNAFNISYKGELYHQDIGQKNLTFGYTIVNDASNSVASLTIPTAASYAIGSLNVGGFAAAADANGIGAVTPVSSPTTSGLTQTLSVTNAAMEENWAPGATLWLTWQMGQGGSGQGIGLDDFSFTGLTIPVSPTLSWNLPGSGAWDTTSGNWAGSTNTFTSGSVNALFGDISADATITVASGGISVPNSVTFSNNNTSATYTVSGGSIGGAASLNVTGLGTVQLTSANTYTGATNIRSGTLIVDKDNELGASGTAGSVLTLKGGTLKLAGNLNGAARKLSVTSLGGTIDTGAFNANFTGSSTVGVSIVGTLVKKGSGDLNLGLQPKFGSLSAPAGHLDIEEGSVSIMGNGRSNAIDQYDGGIYNGNLILKGSIGARLNFSFGNFTGSGEIQIENGSSWGQVILNPTTNTYHSIQLTDHSAATGTSTIAGVVLSNSSGTKGGNIGVNIHLNSQEGTTGHPTFIRTDVSTATFINNGSSNNSIIPAGNFITVIGGTKAVNAGIGPQFSDLVISGVIYGDSDINVGNDYKSGGSGNLHLANHNTYHGATMLNGGGTGLPVLYTDVPNALPADTDVIFGNLQGAGTPTIDLRGNNQTVRSIEVALGGNSPNLNAINNTWTNGGVATLSVIGDVTPFYGFTGQINDGGPTLTDGVGNPIQFAAPGKGVTALVKDGSSKLVLSIYIDSAHTGLSTYSGGTTVRDSGVLKGGSIEIPWDGALGAPTGPVTFDGGMITVRTPDLQYDNPLTHETSVSWTSSRYFTVTANGGTINTPSFTAFDINNAPHQMVASVVMTGNGSTSGYNWVGALQLTGAVGSNMTFNGGTGTVSVTTGASVLVNPTVAFSTGGTSDPFTDSLDSTRHVAIQNNGSFSVNTGAKAIAALTGTGNTTINAGTSLTTSHIVQNSLTVNGAATIRANSSVSKLNSITLAHTGTGTTAAYTAGVELNNNRVVLQTADAPGKAAAILAINEAIFAGHSGSNNVWSGTHGISSATVAADPTHLTLGVYDNAALHSLTLPGQPRTDWAGGIGNVNTSSLLITPALKGDANLDGLIDIADMVVIANNWNLTGLSGGISTIDMAHGDVNQDGVVDIADMVVIANNWNQVSGFNLAASMVDELGSGGGFNLSPSQVPEPASLMILGLCVPMLLRRRK